MQQNFPFSNNLEPQSIIRSLALEYMLGTLLVRYVRRCLCSSHTTTKAISQCIFPDLHR